MASKSVKILLQQYPKALLWAAWCFSELPWKNDDDENDVGDTGDLFPVCYHNKNEAVISCL